MNNLFGFGSFREFNFRKIWQHSMKISSKSPHFLFSFRAQAVEGALRKDPRLLLIVFQFLKTFANFRQHFIDIEHKNYKNAENDFVEKFIFEIR